MKQQNVGFVNTFRNIYFKFVFSPGGAALTEIVPSSTSCDRRGTRSWSSARFGARGAIRREAREVCEQDRAIGRPGSGGGRVHRSNVLQGAGCHLDSLE